MADPRNRFAQIEGAGTGPIIFGQDVSQIPCFRNSWLYGIGAGIFGGLMTFMGTSRPQVATKSAFICLIGTTSFYWIYCRYNFMQEVKQAMQIKEYMEEHNAIRESPRGKQPNLEIVTVSN